MELIDDNGLAKHCMFIEPNDSRMLIPISNAIDAIQDYFETQAISDRKFTNKICFDSDTAQISMIEDGGYNKDEFLVEWNNLTPTQKRINNEDLVNAYNEAFTRWG